MEYIADYDKESHTMNATHRVSARGEPLYINNIGTVQFLKCCI